MLLDTRNKNIHGLGVGILTLFKIFSKFPFAGFLLYFDEKVGKK
jgi:hypothetical protein